MIKSKKELEEKVLEYAPKLKERIQAGDSRAQSELERIAEKQYEIYKPYLRNIPEKIGSVGRGFGYLGDFVFWMAKIAAYTNPYLAPFMLTGLALKKVNLGSQVPEGTRTTYKYLKDTGDKVGAIRNFAAKFISYVPGLTFLDRGLGKIAAKRMVKSTVEQVEEAVGEEKKSWYQVAAEHAQNAGYKDVQVRAGNVIRADFGKGKPMRKAA